MVLLSFAAVYLIWGSTFLAIRIAVTSIPPLLMMGLRCITAGTLLVAVATGRGERAEPRHWGHAIVAGGLMFSCAYGALAWAEQRIASGIAALLVATLPFWLVLIEATQRREVPAVRTIGGVVLGLGGVAALVLHGPSGRLALAPAVVIIAGELAWAGGSLYARPPRLPGSIALAAGMPMIAGGLLLLGVSAGIGEWRHVNVHAISGASATAVAYLVLFGSVVAFSAYQYLMRVAPASRVATHAYVNPVVAVVLGAGLGGEPLTAWLGIAAAAIVVSVALMSSTDAHVQTEPSRCAA